MTNLNGSDEHSDQCQTGFSDEDLNKINEISECISLLANADENKFNESLKKADILVSKYSNKDNVNAKTINAKSVNNNYDNVDQDAFMKEIERDATERAERKLQNRNRATVWKDKGNEFFKASDYDSAVDCYTKGIAIAKDFELIYQNRANCYIKMNKFEDALTDADAAVFLTREKSSKPFFHKGKALAGLGRFDEAKDAFRMMGRCEDGNESLANSRILEIEQLEKARLEESRVLASFSSSPSPSTSTIIDLLCRIAKNGQPMVYYSGGLKVLTTALKTEDDRIMFRNKSGFDLLAKHSVISVVLSKQVSTMLACELEFLESVFCLGTAVVAGNLENSKRLISNEFICRRLLEVVIENSSAGLRLSVLQLAIALSADSSSCKLLCEKVDLSVAVLFFLNFVKKVPTLASPSAALMENLFFCPKHISSLYPKLNPAFMQTVKALISTGSDSLHAFATTINCFVQLCLKPQFRIKFATQQPLLNAIIEASVKHSHLASGSALHDTIVSALLGLATSISFEATTAVGEFSVRFCQLCLNIFKEDHSLLVRERALGLLSNLVPREEACAKLVCEHLETVAILFKLVSGDVSNPALVSVLRISAACLKVSPQFRFLVGDSLPWLEALTALLHASNSSVVGNAALCLSNSLEDTMAAEHLAKTDIIKILLIRMRESKGDSQRNCAILCGKLAQSHHVHRDILRELDGVNILSKLMEGHKFY